MPRINITDIPKDQKISKDELKRIRGGLVALLSPNIGVENQIPVMYNPEKITINKTIPWKDQKVDYDSK